MRSNRISYGRDDGFRPAQGNRPEKAHRRGYGREAVHDAGRNRGDARIMPRTSKGPRLWKRPVRRKNGRIVAASVWIIKDGGEHIATGCLAEPSGKRPRAKAERALAAYIADKYQPPRKTRDVDMIDIADVLSIYRQDHAIGKPHPRSSTDDRAAERVLWWQNAGRYQLRALCGVCQDAWQSRRRAPRS